MLITLLVVLVLLWFFGYIHIENLSLPDISLFAINDHVITLVELLMFLVILAAVGVLPSPLRQIGFVLVVLWVLSTLGIIAIAGLASMLVLAIIIGLIAAMFGGFDSRRRAI